MKDQLEEDLTEAMEADDDAESAEDEGGEPAPEDVDDSDDATEGDEDTEGEADKQGSDEILISFDEPEEDGGNQTIREMREALKEAKRKNRELEQKLTTTAPPEPELGEKPKLADFDYDDERYDEALLAWNERKRQVDAQKAEREELARQEEQEYQERLAAYHAEKAKLGVKDFDEIEEAARGVLPKAVQSVIVDVSKHAPVTILALVRNPQLVDTLLGSAKGRGDKLTTRDLIQITARLKDMEAKMRVTSRTKPAPEKRIASTGGASVPKTSEKQLAKLREEAQRTGDFSKVTAYRRQMQQAK